MKLIPMILVSMSLVLSCNYSRIQTTGAPPNENSTGLITDSQWLTQNLFQPRCASCHNGGRQTGGHKFESEADLLSNLAKKTIIVGSPETSSLYKIIESGAMPTRGEKATATELHVFACWITEGANAESSTCVKKFGLSGSPDPSENQGPGASNPIPIPTPVPGNEGNNDDGDDDNHDDGDDDYDGGHGDDDTGDDGEGDGEPTQEVKFSEIQQPIFAENCTACHGAESPAADVNLLSLDTIKNPMAGPVLVECGKAEESLLYTIVASDEMPAFQEALPADLKLKLKKWIDDGCLP